MKIQNERELLLLKSIITNNLSRHYKRSTSFPFMDLGHLASGQVTIYDH